MSLWVLSGGGIKGVFQVGATLAIEKYDRKKYNPSSVAGTSVGAINGLSLCVDETVTKASKRMLLEYLSLGDRKEMYIPSVGLNKLRSGSKLGKATDSQIMLLADTQIEGIIELVSKNIMDLIGDEIDRSLLSIAKLAFGGGMLDPGGPIGWVSGVGAGAYTTYDRANSILENEQQKLNEVLGRYFFSVFTITPVERRLRYTLSQSDVVKNQSLPIKARFECVGLEDGETYSINESGNLVTSTGEVLDLDGSITDRIVGGISASACIPVFFEPKIFTAKYRPHITLIDGGVRNVFPLTSSLQLLSTYNAGSKTDVVMISNDPVTSKRKSWPLFKERKSNSFDYRVTKNFSDPTIPNSPYILDIYSRTFSLLSSAKEGKSLTKEVLSSHEKVRDLLYVEPNFSVIGKAQVDPALIRIHMSYGYLKTFDTLVTELEGRGAKYPNFPWSSDWITAARQTIWLNETKGSVLDLMFNRILYHCCHALLDLRRSIEKWSSPPKPKELSDFVANASIRPKQADLWMKGDMWMPIDRRYLEGAHPEFEDGSPFTRQRILGPDGIVHFTLPETIRASSSAPLWEMSDCVIAKSLLFCVGLDLMGEAVVSNRGQVVFSVFEIDAIDQGSSSNDVIGKKFRIHGPKNVNLIGVIDSLTLDVRKSSSDELEVHIVSRSESNDYWHFRGVMKSEVSISGQWKKIPQPVDVSSGRNNLPCEGHRYCSSVGANGRINVIATKDTDGFPVVISYDSENKLQAWDRVPVVWPKFQYALSGGASLLDELEREVGWNEAITEKYHFPLFLTPTPVSANGRFMGLVVQFSRGEVGFYACEGGKFSQKAPKLLNPVGALDANSSSRVFCPLNGKQVGDLVALSGIEGNILRRMIIKVDNINGDIDYLELPQLDLTNANNDSANYGKVISTWNVNKQQMVSVLYMLIDSSVVRAIVVGGESERPSIRFNSQLSEF